MGLQNQSGQQTVYNAAMMYVGDVCRHCSDICGRPIFEAPGFLNIWPAWLSRPMIMIYGFAGTTYINRPC